MLTGRGPAPAKLARGLGGPPTPVLGPFFLLARNDVESERRTGQPGFAKTLIWPSICPPSARPPSTMTRSRTGQQPPFYLEGASPRACMVVRSRGGTLGDMYQYRRPKTSPPPAMRQAARQAKRGKEGSLPFAPWQRGSPHLCPPRSLTQFAESAPEGGGALAHGCRHHGSPSSEQPARSRSSASASLSCASSASRPRFREAAIRVGHLS